MHRGATIRSTSRRRFSLSSIRPLRNGFQKKGISYKQNSDWSNLPTGVPSDLSTEEILPVSPNTGAAQEPVTRTLAMLATLCACVVAKYFGLPLVDEGSWKSQVQPILLALYAVFALALQTYALLALAYPWLQKKWRSLQRRAAHSDLSDEQVRTSSQVRQAGGASLCVEEESDLPSSLVTRSEPSRLQHLYATIQALRCTVWARPSEVKVRRVRSHLQTHAQPPEQRPLQRELQALRRELQALQELRASPAAVTEEQRELQALQQELQALKQELQELRAAPAAVTAVTEEQRELQALRQELQELRAAPAAVTEEQRELQALQQELQELRAAPAAVTEEQRELQALRQELQELRALPAAVTVVTEEQRELQALRQELQELRAAPAAVTAVTEEQRELQALRQELQELRAAPSAVTAVTEEQRELQALRQELQELRAAPAAVTEEQRELRALRQELQELRASPAAVTAVTEEQRELQALQQELQELRAAPAAVTEEQRELQALQQELRAAPAAVTAVTAEQRELQALQQELHELRAAPAAVTEEQRELQTLQQELQELRTAPVAVTEEQREMQALRQELHVTAPAIPQIGQSAVQARDSQMGMVRPTEEGAKPRSSRRERKRRSLESAETNSPQQKLQDLLEVEAGQELGQKKAQPAEAEEKLRALLQLEVGQELGQKTARPAEADASSPPTADCQEEAPAEFKVLMQMLGILTEQQKQPQLLQGELEEEMQPEMRPLLHDNLAARLAAEPCAPATGESPAPCAGASPSLLKERATTPEEEAPPQLKELLWHESVWDSAILEQGSNALVSEGAECTCSGRSSSAVMEDSHGGASISGLPLRDTSASARCAEQAGFPSQPERAQAAMASMPLLAEKEENDEKLLEEDAYWRLLMKQHALKSAQEELDRLRASKHQAPTALED
ncbi:hypothetical protein CYMTET_34702 [Cymbomonas tetramitiformis]|uniref:Uncharacterized protein n=1 Tax=Cymbomonas tetramitiformis TaxID=36881 RepID=A0AAE0FAP9_9CHLO|nr:hypothetical protein CYMTET_34702 [Cymbomonas tetramitiformis]